MKHKWYDMIVAKAENMELVVFVKNANTGDWWESCTSPFPFNNDQDFFLCLPQHKDSCLRWLNGSKAQCSEDGIGWMPIKDSSTHGWGFGHAFMTDCYSIRIKPKKEKRWISFNENGNVYGSFYSKDEAKEIHPHYQAIEIEVEV